MHIHRSILDNLRFLIVEVGGQITTLHSYLAQPQDSLAQSVLARRGYAYNLKRRIHDACVLRLRRAGGGNNQVLPLRAVESVATDLERIAELARGCVHQKGYADSGSRISRKPLGNLLERVVKGLNLIEQAVSDDDTATALRMASIERKLNRDYRKIYSRYIGELKQQSHTEDLIAALFIAHRIQQMGLAILNISEAIISANLGQPLNMDRFHSLEASMASLGTDEALSDLVIEPLAETRSGSAINGIGEAEGEGYVAVFKDGRKRKLKEERAGVERWHEIFPGVAPKILSYQKRGESAALLIEHLPGRTFEQILLHESDALLDEALGKLTGTLSAIWDETRSKKRIPAQHMRQLTKRLDEVYGIHPDFQENGQNICGLPQAGFDTLVERAAAYEAELDVPPSVYIHGDFNLDNILYDPLSQKIHFIDLHRSRYMDPVQDVSVFLVSNYRLQVFDRPTRQRITRLCDAFYRHASNQALQHNDHTFDLRLALGLARSFATSTRFILDRGLARAMFLRARYLLERVLATGPDDAPDFRLPIEDLFVA